MQLGLSLGCSKLSSSQLDESQKRALDLENKEIDPVETDDDFEKLTSKDVQETLGVGSSL